nr:putative gustatory receptor 28a [Halyomorpha halys]
MKTGSPQQVQMVAILSDVHNKLCDACETLQTSFAWLLSVLIAVSFVGVTVLTFFMYRSQKMSDHFDIQRLLFEDDRTLWIVCFLSITWNIAASTSELTQKTKEFNHILHHLMANDKSNELIRNEKLLLHLTMRREVVFTACGLFNLDFTLVHSMLAAASTYLVMIIQFDQ